MSFFMHDEILVVAKSGNTTFWIRNKIRTAGFGHRAYFVDSTERAKDCLRENPDNYCIVICDTNMPSLTGPTLYDTLLESKINVPFIGTANETDTYHHET